MRHNFYAVLFGLLVVQTTQLFAQSPSYSTVVQTSVVGNKAYLEINLLNLQQTVDTLFARVGSAASGSSSQSWGDVLSNGSNPGMDINFSSYQITGLGGLTSTGTLSADSLLLGGAAEITGSMSVTDIASFGDSLTVSGYVEFADSLEVLKAVTIGQTLHVTGLTRLGDSLHVAGNVDFNALFNVDGAATFGSTLAVAGKTMLNDSLSVLGNATFGSELSVSDSLRVNSGARIAGTLYVDSVVASDVINGRVSSLANHDTDDLAESSTNLYMTPAERASLVTMMHAIDSLSCTWMKYQGHVYELVLIGDQCWFAENLRAEQYRNGDAIPEVTDNATWGNTSDGARAAYSNDAANVSTYGYLYNWFAVDSAAGLCPGGWHVPSDGEWTELTDFLGGESVAGAQMKSSSSDTPSWDGTNSSGFSALPGGWRTNDGYFYNVGNKGDWWSASPVENNAWCRILYSGSDPVNRGGLNRRFGFSVRCVRD